MNLAIVAGEVSGDRLGAGLIRELRARYPHLRVEGVAGPLMLEAGAQALYPMERLAVMGLGEILRRYRELHAMRADLIRHFLAHPPDVFVGIDAPEFNLGLEERLHRAGVRTVHYVSPQVWAWREGRLKKIARSIDLMLTLFPFEERYYRSHGIPVRCVGHPLAEELPIGPDASQARRTLNLPADGPLLALLPGSRANEWHHHVAPFVRTAAWLHAREPRLRFVVAASSEQARGYFVRSAAAIAPDLTFTVLAGRTREILAAADVVLTVSGTATLKTLLSGRPMVVAYRMGTLSYWVARLLVRVPFIALPNLLADRRLVPEYIQADVCPEKLGPALLAWLCDPDAARRVREQFAAIHAGLRLGGDRVAADAIASLVT
jgi:lipid-A-disaccharide synthase